MYEAELEKRTQEDPDFFEGWDIINDSDHIKTIDDAADLLIFGYEGNAVDTVAEWARTDRSGVNGECGFGYTYKQIISRIAERGLLEVAR